MNWLEEVNSEEGKFNQVLSFDDYMKIFEKNPRQELRTTSLYLKDMFMFYGKNADGSFELFRRDHHDSPAVAGQKKVQNKIFQNILNFTEEGFNNKFLLLIGPNGSSKSSIIRKIIKTAEDYSRTDEGSLYSFSWIFPIDQYVKGGLGLGQKREGKALETYADLEDHEISAILVSELKDHPFLLIPLKTRQKMIEGIYKEDLVALESIKKTYFYNGDLSKRNRLIFDALLKNYKGDYSKVLKHIRVEKYCIEKRYSTGAATIEPQLHVDAQLQQITMDRRLANLPPSLQSLNLFNLNGEIVLANRGILEFSDLLKRPLDTFKYLLMTMETKTINLHGILTELDLFFVGSSNEVHFSAFKQHPDFNSFKGRFNFIKVPYLLNYREEIQIYQDQLKTAKAEGSQFEPHALSALCLWSVMTRMRHPLSQNYSDKKLGDITEKLSPIEKCLLISDGMTPEYLDQEEQHLLKVHVEEIIDEYENDQTYEGKFGISPREVKHIIYELNSKFHYVTFVEVIEYLKELTNKKDEYDFLNIAVQGDYHNPKKFLYFIEHHFLNIIDNEVRESLGLIDNRSYEDYLEKYVSHINALLKKEKIKNTVTNRFEEPDTYFVKEFESNIHLKEDPDNFRSYILSKLGAWALDHPGQKIVYTEVLDSVYKQLKESFRNEQRKIISHVGKNLVFYSASDEGLRSDLDTQGREEIERIISSLKKNFGYSKVGAINSLKYLISKRYDFK